MVDTRKGNIATAFGSPTSPNSIAGGAAAKRALDVFFGGLPGGVVSTRTVTAPAVTVGTPSTISLTIANEHGRKPAGNVALTVKQGGADGATASTAVANDAVTFTVPNLGAGTYEYTLTYAGDDQLAPFTETGTLTVNPVPVVETPTRRPSSSTRPRPPRRRRPRSRPRPRRARSAAPSPTRPTTKKAGKYKVTITTASGKAKATGKVTLTLKKGKTTKKVTGTLKNGVVTVTVPKLAKGTWKVTVAWAGDTTYQAASASGASIKVTK